MKKLMVCCCLSYLLATMSNHDFVLSQTISWQQTNGPLSANVQILALNSKDHIFVGTDGGGVFLSTNNGASWKHMGLPGIHVQTLAINAHSHIFAGTFKNGIFRSTDNGETWTQVNTGLSNISIRSLAINFRGDIFAGTGTPEQNVEGNGIFRSTDNGETWSQVSPNLANTMVPFLVVSPNDNIFAGTIGRGLFRSTDQGETWVQTGLTNVDIYSLAISSSGDIFAGTQFGGTLHHSIDNGNSWNRIALPEGRLSTVCLAINSKGHIFAGGGVGPEDGGVGGIFRSIDNGRSWKKINSGLKYLYIRTIAFNSKGDVFTGPGWGAVYRSTNNGETWEEVITGLSASFVFAFAWSPREYLFVSSPAVYYTSDLGENWIKIGLMDLSHQCLAINSSGHIFAGFSPGGFERPTTGGIFRSTDNGATWTEISNGLMNLPILSLVINSQGHIFAGSGDIQNPPPSDAAIFRSTDNGESWVKLNTGSIQRNVYALAINSNGDIFAGTGNGLLRSTDNGESWIELNTGFSGIEGLSIAINNSNGHIFVGTYLFGGLVIRSTDNGETWTKRNNGLAETSVRFVTINSNGHLFACGGGIFYSQDEGESWTQVNTGLTNTDVYRLAVDPHGFVFASTYSNGVFRTVESTTIVNPPAAPTLAFPPNGAINRQTTLTFHWNPYTSVETYHLQIATNSDFVSPIVDDSTITTASQEIGPLENDKTYYWRVQVKYAGGVSPWSETWSFTTIIGLPNQVALLSPLNSAVIESDTVQFTWQRSSPEIVAYWFELVTDSLMINAQIDSNLSATDTTKMVQRLLNGQTYWWRVRAKNLAGWGPFSEQRRFQVDIGTRVQSDEEVPRVFSLSQNFPNPFNPSTQIAFSIPRSGYTTLKVYNILGHEVAVLMTEKLPVGKYKVNWNSNGLPSGLYFYRLQSSEFVDTKKMILLR